MFITITSQHEVWQRVVTVTGLVRGAVLQPDSFWCSYNLSCSLRMRSDQALVLKVKSILLCRKYLYETKHPEMLIIMFSRIRKLIIMNFLYRAENAKHISTNGEAYFDTWSVSHLTGWTSSPHLFFSIIIPCSSSWESSNSRVPLVRMQVLSCKFPQKVPGKSSYG